MSHRISQRSPGHTSSSYRTRKTVGRNTCCVVPLPHITSVVLLLCHALPLLHPHFAMCCITPSSYVALVLLHCLCLAALIALPGLCPSLEWLALWCVSRFGSATEIEGGMGWSCTPSMHHSIAAPQQQLLRLGEFLLAAPLLKQVHVEPLLLANAMCNTSANWCTNFLSLSLFHLLTCSPLSPCHTLPPLHVLSPLPLVCRLVASLDHITARALPHCIPPRASPCCVPPHVSPRCIALLCHPLHVALSLPPLRVSHCITPCVSPDCITSLHRPSHIALLASPLASSCIDM
jgi:hypothetical protein